MIVDLIVGTAVLRPPKTSGGLWWLFYLKVGENIKDWKEPYGYYTSWDSLPVTPEGETPTEKCPSHFPENRPWRFQISGSTLNVHPSVHIVNHWHNAGAWSVRFLKVGPEVSDHACRKLLLSANLDQPNLDRFREALERHEEV